MGQFTSIFLSHQISLLKEVLSQYRTLCAKNEHDQFFHRGAQHPKHQIKIYLTELPFIPPYAKIGNNFANRSIKKSASLQVGISILCYTDKSQFTSCGV